MPNKSPVVASFALDVGGTFTDCLAQLANGTTRRLKVLSSSVVKGIASRRGTDWIDPQRSQQCDGFWRTASLRWLADDGTILDQARVVEFESRGGRLELEREILAPIDKPLRYELTFGSPAPLLAIRQALGLRGNENIPAVDVRLGTTRGTNALLTRSGASTAWVTTRGFADLLHIGDQQRPRLFDLSIQKPKPLFCATAEIDERMDASGQVIRPLDLEQARRELVRLKQAGIEALAIALLHAYREPAHELQLESLARDIGFDSIRLSHRTAPVIKLVARGRTTLVDAYLDLVLKDYLAAIGDALGAGSRLSLMTSAGDLVSPERFSGKDSLLSGPAGGVVGLARVSRRSGKGRGIGFDMGGTSTDVSRYDGRFEIESESHKAEVAVVVPTLAIETVAAGGGSICRVSDGRLLVGPESAGADPGPACYGRGGPLTVTDLNVWLGRVRAERFPFPLDRAAIERRLNEEQSRLATASGIVGDTCDSAALHRLALGWWRIANAKMAAAIRSVSVGKGYDPRRYPLVAFGGAAAQHACAVAEELGMTTVLCPADASILSAAGIGAARRSVRLLQGVYAPLVGSNLDALEDSFRSLEAQAKEQLERESSSAVNASLSRAVELRYAGTDAPLRLELDATSSNVREAFEELHRRRFGYVQQRAIEIVALHVSATEPDEDRSRRDEARKLRQASSSIKQTLITALGIVQGQVFERQDLGVGDWILGPAIIVDDHSTIVVDVGWEALILESGTIELRAASGIVGDTRESVRSQTSEISTELDAVEVELFANHFQSIAEQMGITLRNTAASVNVKERLDFSCAIFDSQGRLVVNAPHIPVHLGAMSETVRCLVRDERVMRRGDVFLTNDPYLGGSHLPDLTVITPVFIGADRGATDQAVGLSRVSNETNRAPSFFVASRAHHAEIGGLTPGSMPASSKTLGDEGVVLRHFRVVSGGVDRLESLARGLSGRPELEDADRLLVRHPSRSPQENVADIQAQIAANRQGEERLIELCLEHSEKRVAAAMEALQSLAQQRLNRVLKELGEGERRFVDRMDDGSQIAVTLRIAGGRLTIDFAGTSGVHPGNLNANRGIVTAAVMYVLRCLMSHEEELWRCRFDAEPCERHVERERSGGTSAKETFEVPLNHGLLENVEIVIPPGMLNPPQPREVLEGAAVVGGNVETSQRVVDVLLGAIGIAAASQGSMNNLLFGDETFGYYETICGGSGATPWSDGADAVHTHMTNTRITDPEVLERRFPVRLWRFAIRRGSGGAGERRGGDGVIREFEFLKPLTVSLLTNRRTTQPYGLCGGRSGESGVNEFRASKDEQESELGSSTEIKAEAGSRLTVKTPGAGAWGEAKS